MFFYQYKLVWKSIYWGKFGKIDDAGNWRLFLVKQTRTDSWKYEILPLTACTDDEGAGNVWAANDTILANHRGQLQ